MTAKGLQWCRASHGFTLIEVLVALTIVAVTLMAGLQAVSTLARSGERQTERVLAQLCAENALVQIRLSEQFPDTGDTRSRCEQGGRELVVQLIVAPTPNPNFRRVEAHIFNAGNEPLLRLITLQGRY